MSSKKKGNSKEKAQDRKELGLHRASTREQGAGRGHREKGRTIADDTVYFFTKVTFFPI